MQVPAHASCGGWLYGRTVTQGVAQGARHRGRERCVAGVVAHGGDALADHIPVVGPLICGMGQVYRDLINHGISSSPVAAELLR